MIFVEGLWIDLELYAILNVVSQQFSKARTRAVLFSVKARALGPYVMGTGCDNGGPDTVPTEMQTNRSLDTLVQYHSCPDDRDLGTAQAFRILIRSVAAVYLELCVTKRKNIMK